MKDEKEQIEHSKLMGSAKTRGVSKARMRALMKMEIHRKKKRKEKIRKTVDR